MRHALVPILLLTLVAAPALAQDEPVRDDILADEPPPLESSSQLQISFDLIGQYQFESDLDESDVSIARVAPTLKMRQEINREWRWAGAFGYAYQNYDFSRGTRFGDAWEDIHAVGANLVFEWDFATDWTMLLGGFVRATTETDAAWEDAISGGGVVGLLHRFDDDLTVGAAVSIFSRLEDSVGVIAIPLIHWQITDTLRVRTQFDAGAIGQATYELVWDMSRELDLGFGVRAGMQDYRIEEEDRHVEEETLQLVGRLNWNYAPEGHLWLAGGITWADFRLETDSGRKITDDDFEAEPFVELGWTIRF